MWSGWAAAGIDHAIVGPRGPWDEAALDAVAGILPEVHGIGSRCTTSAAQFGGRSGRSGATTA